MACTTSYYTQYLALNSMDIIREKCNIYSYRWGCLFSHTAIRLVPESRRYYDRIIIYSLSVTAERTRHLSHSNRTSVAPVQLARLRPHRHKSFKSVTLQLHTRAPSTLAILLLYTTRHCRSAAGSHSAEIRWRRAKLFRFGIRYSVTLATCHDLTTCAVHRGNTPEGRR